MRELMSREEQDQKEREFPPHLVETAGERGASREAALQEQIAAPSEMLEMSPLMRAFHIEPGTIFAEKYKVISLIGHGGMADVYLAEQMFMRKQVALKILRPQLAMDAGNFERFLREAQAASRLSHAHIITIFDSGASAEGLPYIAMEYVDGSSLADLLGDKGRLSVSRMVPIISQVCEALEHAHRKGIIHRDLKPSNIMITMDEEGADFVRVVDFGIAKILAAEGPEDSKLTQTGSVFGSPMYMSPEQCSGKKLDSRSDIYSLGCVMYECLTGSGPFVGTNSLETMHKHVVDEPQPFNVICPELYFPARVEQAILKALSKSPDDRQQSMTALRDALTDTSPALTTAQNRGAREGIAAKVAPIKTLAMRWARNILVVMGAIFVTLLVLSALFPEHNKKPIEQRSISHKEPPVGAARVSGLRAIGEKQTQSRSTIPNGAALYEIKEAGISFYYPGDWQVKPGKDWTTELSGPLSTLSIRAPQASDDLSPRVFANMLEKDLFSGTVPGYKKISEREMQIGNDVPAVLVDTEFRMNGYDFSQKHVYFRNGTGSCMMAFTTLGTGNKAESGVFENILQSLVVVR